MANLKPMSEVLGKKATPATKHVIDSVPDVRIKTRLAEILDERKMTQAELVRLTGIPKNQISAFVTNKPTAKLSYYHIVALMIALRLDSIDQLMVVDFPAEYKEQAQKERSDWIETRREPLSIQKLLSETTALADN